MAAQYVSSHGFFRSWVKRLAVVVVYIISVEVLPARSDETLTMTPATELKRLRSDLLQSYDRNERPAKNQSVPTSVKLLFDVRYVVGLDEKYQILTVKGVLMLKWTDEHLTWDPASYSDISAVRFAPKDVWLPDIHSIYNVKAVDIYDEKHSTPVIVYSNGSAKWYPPAVFDVPCSAQFRHYPFDSHQCTIVFGAWTHSGDTLDLQSIGLPISQSISAAGTGWILEEVTHQNDVYKVKDYYRYPMVKVGVRLRRASRIYRYVCVVPTFVSLISSLFGFWLLPHDTSRYMIGCSNVIMMSMLLQHLAVTVPAGKVVPLLAEYCASCLCMSVVFLLVTVATNLLRESSGIPPTALLRLSHQSLDWYLCLSTFSHFSNGEGQLQKTTPEEAKRRKDWARFSLVVDRVSFWAFVLIYVILVAVLASI